MTEFSEHSDNERERHENEDIQAALLRIDPNGWIIDRINSHNANTQLVEFGVTTDYNPLSYENDSVYKDSEMAERVRDLAERYDAAVIAVAALYGADRSVKERFEELHSADLRAQHVARKLLDLEDVTVQDILSSQDKPDSAASS